MADAIRPIIAAIVGRRGTPAITPSSTDTCRDWVRNRDNAIFKLAHVVVLEGYITSYNQWGPDPRGDAIGVDDQALIEKSTDKWYSANPSGLLIGTVTPLINDVAAERAAGRLPPAGMRPSGKYSREIPRKRGSSRSVAGSGQSDLPDWEGSSGQQSQDQFPLRR